VRPTALWIAVLLSLSSLAEAASGSEAPTYDLIGPLMSPGYVVQEYSSFLFGPMEATFRSQGASARVQMHVEQSKFSNYKLLHETRGEWKEFEQQMLLDATSTLIETGSAEPELTMERSPIEGMTVRLSKRGSHWDKTLVDHKPSAAELSAMENITEPGPDSLAYPLDRVPIGYSWTMGPNTLQALFGAEMEVKNGRGDLTFREVSVVEGDSCAVIGFTLQAKVEMTREGSFMSGSLTGEGRILRSLETGVERENFFRGQAVFKGAWASGGGPLEGTMTGPVTITSSSRLLSKRP